MNTPTKPDDGTRAYRHAYYLAHRGPRKTKERPELAGLTGAAYHVAYSQIHRKEMKAKLALI